MKNSTITFSTDKIIVVLDSFVNTCDKQIYDGDYSDSEDILTGAIEAGVQMIEALKFGDNAFHVYYSFNSLLGTHKFDTDFHKIGYTRALRVLLNSLKELSQIS